MSGNVWEWVEDCYHASYEGAPVDGSAWDSKNNGNCGKGMLRGGSYNDRLSLLRSANRHGGYKTAKDKGNGFRIAKSRQKAAD